LLELGCRDALPSGIKALIKVAKTLARYRTALLNGVSLTARNRSGSNRQIPLVTRQDARAIKAAGPIFLVLSSWIWALAWAIEAPLVTITMAPAMGK
jgi:hypothetical protein